MDFVKHVILRALARRIPFPPVILRSVTTKNLHFEILHFVQDDRYYVILRSATTKNLIQHVILKRKPKNPHFEILRSAQDDICW